LSLKLNRDATSLIHVETTYQALLNQLDCLTCSLASGTYIATLNRRSHLTKPLQKLVV
jgi:hypothetical protein